MCVEKSEVCVEWSGEYDVSRMWGEWHVVVRCAMWRVCSGMWWLSVVSVEYGA